MNIQTMILGIILITVSVYITVNADENDRQNQLVSILEIELSHGDHVFVGRHPSSDHQLEQVHAIIKSRVSQEPQSDAYALRVEILPGDRGDNANEEQKRLLVDFRATYPRHILDAMNPPSTEPQWYVPVFFKSALTPIEGEVAGRFEDISGKLSVDGLKAYRAPYAQVEGETSYVLVLIAQEMKLIQGAIGVSNSHRRFWETWRRVR